MGIEEQEEDGEEVGGEDETGVAWWVDGRKGGSALPAPDRHDETVHAATVSQHAVA